MPPTTGGKGKMIGRRFDYKQASASILAFMDIKYSLIITFGF